MTIDAPVVAHDLPQASSSARGLVVLENVHKRWGARSVLEDASLAVEPGTLVWISGANGIGKTTLLRIAAGLIHADSGRVELDGLHPERNRRAYLGRLGFLSAGDRGLYARLSVRRHLDLGARLALLAAEERLASVERALTTFALEELADRRADRLSTGQRQRVRLAMTFIHDPPVVLLDEPANSLDQDGLGVLSEYLVRLRRRGGGAIWCSPAKMQAAIDFDVALRLAAGRLSPA